MKYSLILLLTCTTALSQNKTLEQQGRTEFGATLQRTVKHDESTPVSGGEVRVMLETDKHQSGTILTLYNNSTTWIEVKDVVICRKTKTCNFGGKSLRNHKKCASYHIAPNESQKWQYNYQVFGSHDYKDISFKLNWSAVKKPNKIGKIISCI